MSFTLAKLHRLLFFLVLVFLPTNLAKHFDADFALVSGVVVDYLLPTLYLTDILLVLLFLFWGLEILKKRGNLGGARAPFGRNVLYLLLLFLIFSTPTIATVNKWAAWLSWLKLAEGLLLVAYIQRRITFSRDFSALLLAISVGIFYESLLALLQWVNQRTIFGFFFLGEPVYTAVSLGIARISFAGREFVRSYGTLPHPNVLGGYLALFLPWVLAGIFWLARSLFWRLYFTLVFFLGLLALFLSFSRTAWLAGTGGIVAILFTVLLNSWPRMKAGRGGIFACAFLLLGSLLGGLCYLAKDLSQTLSWLLRFELLKISFRMFLANILFGVGLNNFVVRLGEFGKLPLTYQFLQPAHNIFLLIGSELGIFGLVIFIGLLFYVFKRVLSQKKKLEAIYVLIALSQIVFLGMFDHYFLTLQQGRLMLFLVLGLATVL